MKACYKYEMMNFPILCVSSMLIVGFAASDERYLVVEVFPQKSQHLHLFHQLEEELEDFTFWSEAQQGGGIKLLVNNDDFNSIGNLLRFERIRFRVKFKENKKIFAEANRQIKARRLKHKGRGFDFLNFHRYAEIVGLFEKWALENPMFSSWTIGRTHENRGIIVGQISTGSDPNKPVFVLECGIHAREWISPASCLWMMNQLLAKYGRDREITYLVDSFDFVVIPVVNPDGYEYSWGNTVKERLYRKNRNPNHGLPCQGVDLNRNFDADFGGVRSSSDSCRAIYQGKRPFSEPESRAIRDLLASLRPRVKVYISVHSHSQAWVTPFGSIAALPKEYFEMFRVLSAGISALEATHGTPFAYGNGPPVLYYVSGTTRDYVYQAEGIVYSSTIELRDEPYGFIAPPDEILPTAEEAFNGIKAMLFAILDPEL